MIASSETMSASDIRELIEPIVAAGGPPGIAVCGEVAGVRIGAGAGRRKPGSDAPVDERTRFQIGCIMKPLLALLCLELYVQGRLDIHAPITDYLPELADTPGAKSAITIAHLLSHSGGYVEPQEGNPRWLLDWESFVDFFPNRRQAFTPGIVWSYTQTGHVITGRIIQLITGRDPVEIISETILAPLGVELGRDLKAFENSAATYIAMPGRYGPIRLPAENPFFRPSISALTLSPSDMITLATLMSGAARPDFLSAKAYDLFATPIIDRQPMSGGALREATPTAYGLGLAHYGRLIGHSGSYVAHACAIRFEPVTKTAFAVATSAWTPGFRDNLINKLFHKATGEADFLSLSRCRVPMALENYVGQYKALMIGMDGAEITLAGDALTCRMRSANEPVEASLSVNAEGYLSGRVPHPAMSFALAAAPDTGEPYLCIGMTAYKKI